MTARSWAIEVEGLDATRRALRELGVKSKDLNAAYRSISRVAATRAQGKARSGTRLQAAAARAFIGSASGKGAEIGIRNLGSVPFGQVAFLGSARRTGWAARGRSAGGARRPQHPAWVGNSWDIEAGEGPYVLTDVINEGRDEFVSMMQAEIDRLIAGQGLF